MTSAMTFPHDTPAPKLGRLLIVDDEVELMTVLREMLTEQGFEAVGLASGAQALEALRAQEFDLLLADLMMPGLDGIALLRAGLALDPDLVGIIMTGQGTVPTAVEAMQVGAFDYLLKPFKLSAILPVVARALGVRRLRLENVQLRETVAIYELSQAIAFTLDLNTILSKTADAALEQCEADEVSLLLPVPGGEALYVAAVRGVGREHLLGQRLPLAQSIAGWVARQREPLTLQGEMHDPRFAPLYPRADIYAAISMPMLAGNRLVGVLNVNATRRRRRFSLGQVKALSLLVNTAAAALANAWLHTQVQEAEAQYRAIFENAVEGIYQSTPEGRFLTVNPALVHMLGFASPAELTQSIHDIARQLYVDSRRRAELLGLLQTNEVVSGFELQARRKDDRAVWLSVNVRAVRDGGGALRHL